MVLIICDGNENLLQQIESYYQKKKVKYRIISQRKEIKACLGCFGCWIKNPGECVIQDGYNRNGEWQSKSQKVIFISKCFYGGYSPFVKNVVDRSISYVLPDFTKRNGEMHHKLRYQQSFETYSIFYGEDITAEEKATAKALIHRNAINMNAKEGKVSFVPRELDVLEVLP